MGDEPHRSGGAGVADQVGPAPALRPDRDHGARCRSALQRAPRHRALPLREPDDAAERGRAASCAWLRGPGRHSPPEEQQRRFVAIRHAVQRRALPGRPLHGGASRSAARAARACGCPASTAWPPRRSTLPDVRFDPPPSSAIWPADPARRFAGPAPGCPAAGPTRWRSCGSRGSGWSDTASPRPSCTRSATRAPRCSGWWSRCGRRSSERSRRRGRSAIPWATLASARSSEVRRRLLVDWQARHRLDARATGRRQPAAVLRLPPARRRPAPDAVRPGAAQRHHRRHPLPPSAVAGARGRVGALYPVADLPAERRREIEQLEQSLPALADLMASHRSAGAARARSSPTSCRRRAATGAAAGPARAWKDDLGVLARQSPTLVFAVLGQARAAGRVDPVQREPGAVRRPDGLGGAQQPRRRSNGPRHDRVLPAPRRTAVQS